LFTKKLKLKISEMKKNVDVGSTEKTRFQSLSDAGLVNTKA
jgi:hypothetical protein